MFDIGWQELFIVVAIAIIVVGPRDLPRVLRSITSYLSKARSMVREFQSGIDEVAREVDLDDIRKEAQDVANADFEDDIKDTLEPVKALENEFEFVEDEKFDEELTNHSNKTSNRKDLSDSSTKSNSVEATMKPETSKIDEANG